MKARVFYDVICDYCRRALSEDVGAEPRSRLDAIRMARERGWRTLRRRNACPECVRRLGYLKRLHDSSGRSWRGDDA